MAAEVLPGRHAVPSRIKSDPGSDRRDSVKSDTSSTVGGKHGPRPQDKTTRRRSVAVMDLGNQPRKPAQAFKSALGAGGLLASRRGVAAFRSMFLPRIDTEPEVPKIPGIVRFRKAVRVVRLLCMVCIVCRKILSQTIIEGSWLAMVDTILQEAEESAKKAEDQSKGSGQLSFDPHKFRRSGKHEDAVPSRVKELLRKPAAERTEEEADTIVRTMQKMPDFALYPVEIQKQLCQVAWFDSFGTGRVIIREGHAADGFYFVLSGRLVESHAAEDEANTVLRLGMKFGERELLTRTKRKSTVLTQERTELFCVHVQDYVRIFNLQDDMETANLKVCRRISIFDLWPLKKLLEHPDAWTMQNYQPGFVIVPDSRRCDWIYVVKTGQCKVLKRLTHNEGWTVDQRVENRLLYSREMGRAHRERGELFTAQGDREKDTNTLISVLWRNAVAPRTPISGINNSRMERRANSREKGPSRLQLSSRIFDPDPSKPVFVVLDVLGPGQSFGFLSVLPSSERGASVSLVSNSAEVIQIKKKFFLKYADETVLSLIKMKYPTYPSQEDVLESLWKEHQWEDFKRDALYRAVSSVTSRQAVKLQPLQTRPKTTKTN